MGETTTILGTHNGHDYVDLGLPSGTMWATRNIGASGIEDFGDFYAWGEIRTKTKFKDSNYTHVNKGVFTKYNEVDGISELEAIDDVAAQLWGGGWCMPTIADFKELIANCKKYHEVDDGCVKIYSKSTDNSILLPCRKNDSYTIEDYWLRSRGQGVSRAFTMRLILEQVYVNPALCDEYVRAYIEEGAMNRTEGLLIRPVFLPTKQES